MEYIYLIYSKKNQTYEIGGGSSTPSRERVFYSYDQALKIRDRWFRGHEIHSFKRNETLKTTDAMMKQREV